MVRQLFSPVCTKTLYVKSKKNTQNPLNSHITIITILAMPTSIHPDANGVAQSPAGHAHSLRNQPVASIAQSNEVRMEPFFTFPLICYTKFAQHLT